MQVELEAHLYLGLPAERRGDAVSGLGRCRCPQESSCSSAWMLEAWWSHSPPAHRMLESGASTREGLRVTNIRAQALGASPPPPSQIQAE